LAALGRPAEAENAYREALRLKPLDAPSRFALWAVLEREGKHESAEAAYREAIALWPDHAEAHERLRALLLRQGRLAEAEQQYAEARQPGPAATSLRGSVVSVRWRRASTGGRGRASTEA
jgi:tetratricopeptide (TPR) repeat protein